MPRSEWVEDLKFVPFPFNERDPTCYKFVYVCRQEFRVSNIVFRARVWLSRPLLASQTGVHVIRMEVTLANFLALTIQSTTQTRRDVPGVSQYPVTIAYWLYLMNSKRREIPMFWKSTVSSSNQAKCRRTWVVICRTPPTAPVDLLCGSSSQRTGISLGKDSTQPTPPLSSRVRI